MAFIFVLGIVGVAAFLIFGGNMAIIPTTQVQAIAKAIARAEGFYVQGSVPQRANNPGDLKEGDKGYGLIDDKTVFPSPGQGWNALYAQVQAILDNRSKYYNSGMTIAEIGMVYSGGDPNWAQNVADTLGVDTETPIGQVSA
jgi:hypothetical protein